MQGAGVSSWTQGARVCGFHVWALRRLGLEGKPTLEVLAMHGWVRGHVAVAALTMSD